tara:strand:+ start:2648 stop:3541 length:894 start_codon:yes stop_codon:yes gene_type:complete
MQSLKRFSKRLLKGKAFRKSEFGTGWSDMTVRGALKMRASRDAGQRRAPARLDLPAENGKGAGEPPVRIFIGTEPAQHRAERVLLWSIYRNRNVGRHYEIYLMKDLAGFDRRKWKTGFTAYRYAIPEFTGFQGRAIYNDVDQIYLADPARLFDLDMAANAVLAVESRDTSVMLMDCARLEELWTIEDIGRISDGKLHTPMLRKLRERHLIANLDGRWNARDHEYDPDSSCLLHYTILHTQPWQPFPRDLRYRRNANAEAWTALEDEADAARFAPAWKTQASRSYGEMDAIFTIVADE